MTAIVVARIERKPEQLCVGDEFQEVSDVVQNWTEIFETSQGYANQNETPSSGCQDAPTDFD